MNERRKYKRYSMPRGTFAILRNELEQLNNHRRMSIGEIAMVLYKSESQMMGQVANMSLGGIAFENPQSHIPTGSDMELDLLMTEKGIYLHNIPFSTMATSSGCDKKNKTNGSQRTALRFTNLDSQLKSELRELISHHIG